MLWDEIHSIERIDFWMIKMVYLYISFNERDHARGFTANWLNEQEQLKIAFVENTANSSNPNLRKSLFHNFVKSMTLYRIYDAKLWYKGNMQLLY